MQKKCPGYSCLLQTSDTPISLATALLSNQFPAHRMHLIAAKIWFTSILVPATVQYGKSKPFRHPSIGHDHHEYHLAQPTQSPPYPGGGRSSSGSITPDRVTCH